MNTFGDLRLTDKIDQSFTYRGHEYIAVKVEKGCVRNSLHINLSTGQKWCISTDDNCIIHTRAVQAMT